MRGALQVKAEEPFKRTTRAHDLVTLTLGGMAALLLNATTANGMRLICGILAIRPSVQATRFPSSTIKTVCRAYRELARHSNWEVSTTALATRVMGRCGRACRRQGMASGGAPTTIVAGCRPCLMANIRRTQAFRKIMEAMIKRDACRLGPLSRR